MRPSGTIYISGKSHPIHGEIILQLSKVIRGVYFFLRGVGLGLIILAIYMSMTSFGAMFLAEATYYYKANIAEKPKYDTHIEEVKSVVNVQYEAEVHGVNPEFSIVIPKIDAKSDVIANVDVTDEDEYLDALTKGVAHAKGMSFPGQGGRIFLFSHSTNSPLNFTRYNAIFLLLKKLEEKDNIIVYFADKKYEYEVTEKKITSATDVSWLSPKSEGEELVLMTCDPPGTSWNRLLVVAKPVV